MLKTQQKRAKELDVKEKQLKEDDSKAKAIEKNDLVAMKAAQDMKTNANNKTVLANTHIARSLSNRGQK